MPALEFGPNRNAIALTQTALPRLAHLRLARRTHFRSPRTDAKPALRSGRFTALEDAMDTTQNTLRLTPLARGSIFLGLAALGVASIRLFAPSFLERVVPSAKEKSSMVPLSADAPAPRR